MEKLKMHTPDFTDENIARIAGEHKCDAILMGSHGAGTIRSVLMGSTTTDVIRLAPCPVTVVK